MKAQEKHRHIGSPGTQTITAPGGVRFCHLVLWLLLGASTGAAEEGGKSAVAESRFGRVHFAISSTPAAQAQFDRAVAMLHSFWYEELAGEFGKVLELDPNCAMGYWGLAMGLWHPLWEPPPEQDLRAGRAALEKGRSIGAKSPREQAYLDAIGSFYADYEKVGHEARVQRYAQAMSRVHELYPLDNEARAFYALALLAAAPPNDRTYTNQLRAAALLEEVASVHTNHPGVVHYLIHAYDTPTLAARGLREAWCYSEVAPVVPHALHMPSHIYTRLGLWPDSIKANLASANAARNYAAQVKMAGMWDEELHAMDYLVYAYLQTAQDRAAQNVVEQVRKLGRAEQQSFKAAYPLAAIPARHALERRRWAEAAVLELEQKTFPWSNHAWPLALNRFARCLGAARAGRVAEARQELESLVHLRPERTDTPLTYGFRQIRIMEAAARAWTARAQHQDEEALRWMRQAADQEDAIEKKPVTPGPLLPARELLGELLLETGRAGEALSEFEKALAEAPKRFNSLYGAGCAAASLGEKARARAYFKVLVSVCEKADSERPELLAARRALEQE
jgi:tetratricopeptide (TPR) repeat protein